MLKARSQINQLTQTEMKQMAEKALFMQTSDQVKQYVKETLKV